MPKFNLSEKKLSLEKCKNWEGEIKGVTLRFWISCNGYGTITYVFCAICIGLSKLTISSGILLLIFSLVFFFLLVLLADSPTSVILLLDGHPFSQTINRFFTVAVTFELLNCSWFTFSTLKINNSLREV